MRRCASKLPLLACPLVLFAEACAAQDAPNPTDDPLPTASASASIPVEGGSLELDDGARVDFPAGALAEATEVTLRRLDCDGIYQAGSFASCRYAVEAPAGTLAGAYQLTLPTRGPGCATQQTVDGLVCMFGGVSSGDAITTLANTFGEFTSWADDAIIPTDACVMPNFAACGGDLTGSWTMTGGCGTIEQLTNVSWTGSNPYESCDRLDYYRGYPFSVSGALAFLADGYTISSGFSILKHEIITEACLASVGETCNPDCALVDGVCECLFPKSDGEGVSGDDVWSTPEAGVVQLGAQSHRYCIDADTLTVEWGSEAEPYYTVYSRD